MVFAIQAVREFVGQGLADNVGTGRDISIAEFAQLVAEIVGFTGTIEFDTARPDGAPQKLLDVAKLTALGWQPKIALREGLAAAYADFVATGGRRRAAA